MTLQLKLQEERQEGRKEGLQEGRKEGLENGIEIFVLDNIEEGVSPERIIAKLVRRYQINEAEAREYFQRFVKESV